MESLAPEPNGLRLAFCPGNGRLLAVDLLLRLVARRDHTFQSDLLVLDGLGVVLGEDDAAQPHLIQDQAVLGEGGRKLIEQSNHYLLDVAGVEIGSHELLRNVAGPNPAIGLDNLLHHLGLGAQVLGHPSRLTAIDTEPDGVVHRNPLPILGDRVH